MATKKTRTTTSSKKSLAHVAKKAKRKEATMQPHLIVEARAGTGKTTTLVEGLNIIRGNGTELTPSPQQDKVWTAMKKGPKPRSVLFCSFNKSIAEELADRVPEGCDAKTLHSHGYGAVKNEFGRLKRPNKFRTENIISEIKGKDIRELKKDNHQKIKSTADLVNLCKMNLVNGDDLEELSNLASHYDVETNGDEDEIFEMIPVILDKARDVEAHRYIDFADMIWLPVVLDLYIPKYDLLLVDEAQDLNPCQQELAMRTGKRLILCGDPKQAIYGFAGADTESMNRMEERLSDTDRGCKRLPLTVTRRCGRAIVQEANKVVSDFSYHEDNSEGMVDFCSMEDGNGNDYTASISQSDMVLCRVNAPLVSECFRLIKLNKRANIRGRNIGEGLIKLVKKLDADGVPDLVGKLDDWYHRESMKEGAKVNPSDTKLIALQDKKDCITHFLDSDGVETIDDLTTKIDYMFQDKREEGVIMFSSIHKAKGLEADNVYLIKTEKANIPHPMAKSAWAQEQEYNLLYVAITRAKNRLTYVS